MSDCNTKSSKSAYKLRLEEYDGKEAFWTGKMPYASIVECSFAESDLHVPIGRVIEAYVPMKYIACSDGVRNLTTNRKKRVEIDSPLGTIFESDVKKATLYVHFGSVFEQGFHQRNDQYFQEAIKTLNKSFDLPGFWDGEAGAKVKELMRRVDAELKKSNPNMGIVQQKLCRMTKMMESATRGQRKEKAKQKRIKAVFKILFVLFLIVGLLGFLNYSEGEYIQSLE